MEYYVNKDPVVAGKIFEVGIKTFALDKDEYATQYVLHYIEFLTCLNDDNNTRALFERALSAIPSNQSEPIWKRYIQYETQYGDVSNLYKIEKRKSQISTLDVNSVESAETIAKKWCWYDLDIVGTFEIGLEALLLSSRLPAPVTSTKPLAREKKDDKGRSLASLGGVKDVDKYPKPELGRWNMYKPEPGMSRNMDIVTIKPVATKKPTAAQIQPSNTKPIGMLVPEPIAKMAALLPRRETYDGPIINVTELLALLLRLPLPVPLNNNIKMVPLPAGQVIYIFI
jgi:cleavage stimulation factor subunit 3